MKIMPQKDQAEITSVSTVMTKKKHNLSNIFLPLPS